MDREIDHLDSEHVDDTVKSAGYGLIATRINGEIAKLTNDLVLTRYEPAETNEIRGRILGLRLALQIPQNIATESRARRKP